jgi:hypothetical protein
VPVTLGILAAFLLLSQVDARTMTSERRPTGRRFDVIKLAKNQWTMPITNYGSFGHDVVRGTAGGEWPRGSGNMYIYGAGIWFGRMKKGAAATDTTTHVGYNPNSGKAEFTPGAFANAGGGYAGRDFERVYAYPDDWPPDPAKFPASMQDSFQTALKVPTPSGDTIYGWFSPIPRKAISSGDCWSVFNDGDPANMEANGKTIGIEIYQFIYAWSLPWNRDVVFFVCNVKNVSPDTIKDAYMAMVCDGDIGGADNDFAGLIQDKYIHNALGTDSIRVDNVGMEWSGPETGWPTYPGVLAFDFLQSPYQRDSSGKVPGIDGIDNNANGLIDEPAEGDQIGMTAYKIFTLQAGDPTGDGKQYLAMQGKDWWITPPPYNPFDSLDNTPADKRFLQATGPFSIAPDSMVTLTIGVIGAPLRQLPSDRDTSFWALAVSDQAAQSAYDNNWVMPQPPPGPGFTLLPGNGKVTIMWDNSPENVPDPFFPLSRALKSPYYKEVDFQGYKVWRSLTGRVGEWKLLTQFDKRDGLTFQDSTQPDSIRTRATDNGLSYAYIDSSSLRLGFPYFYAVSSFDYNTVGEGADTSHLTLESGMLPLAITPRTDAANYRPAQTDVHQTAGNPDIGAAFVPKVIAPHAIKSEQFEIRFGEQRYSGANAPTYSFCVLNSAGDTVSGRQTFNVDLRKITDTTRLTSTIFDSVVRLVRYDSAKQETVRTKGWLPTLELQIKVKMDSIPLRIFDSIHVTGNYPPSKLALAPTYPGNFYNFYIWAYRGNDYRIVWKNNERGKLTAEVADLILDQPVAYRTVPIPPAPDSGVGWTLYDSLGGTRPRFPTDTVTPRRTRSMYINGGLFDLNRGRTMDPDTLPAPGDTWYVFAARLTAAPIFATYELKTEPMEFTTAKATLHVKVVPNPYLVRNEWERHPDFRRLRFIDLPDKCTIRIYTLAGDLIKTIEHDATNARAGNIPNQQGGDAEWDLLSAAGQKPAPGIYLFHVESELGTQIGKFAIVY